MAAVRLKRIVPWASMEQLQERGVDLSNLEHLFDSFTRFLYRLRGRLMRQRLRRSAPLDNPFLEWRNFNGGSLQVLQTIRLSSRVYFRGDVLNATSIEFTLSHFRVIVEDDEDAGGRRAMPFPYLSIAALNPDPLENSMRLILQLRVDATDPRPQPLIFGLEDAPPVLSALMDRLSHRFKLGNTIVGGMLRKGLRIVHFNDVYHLTPFKNPNGRGLIGGASRFLTKLREIQTTHNPLILFSGDFMSPSLMSVLMKGKHMIDAFNLIGVHYATFGNHEFDYGMAALKECIHGYVQGNFVFAGSNTQWIMSNMKDASGAPLGGVLSQASVVWNGTQVGLLGISENWLPQCNQLAKGEGVYFDMFETAERMAQDMKRSGAEVVIVLGHNRYDNDKQLTSQCPSVDLVLGGHDHFYKNSPRHRVIKSGEEFEFLTEVEIVVDPETKIVRTLSNAHPITKDIEPHPSMEAIIGRYDKRLQARMGRIIGTNSIPLDCTEACTRFREGILPGFVTDVMASRSKADFAVLGGAAIAGKNIKPPGDITVGDVFNWFPNDTRIMSIRIRGATVKKLLDVMVREVPDEAPSFPHPSANLSFVINTMRTPTTVDHITVSGRPIDMDAEYAVAVETFVGLGKAKYKFIPKEGTVLADDESAEQITFWMLDYFEGGSGKKRREKHYALMSNSARAHRKFAATLSAPPTRSIQVSRRMSFEDLLNAPPALTGGDASKVLAESAKVLRTNAPTQIETLMFQAEVALRSLGGVDSARLFHVALGEDAWYRADGDSRRVTVPLMDRFGFACCAREGSVLIQRHDDNNDFDPLPLNFSVETTLQCMPASYAFLPIKSGGRLLAVAVIANATRALPSHFELLSCAEYIVQIASPLDLLTRKALDELEDKQRSSLIVAATDIVQSGDNVTVNDKLANISSHAKKLFACDKAYFYVLDHDEMWTVRRSLATSKKIEDVVIRKLVAACGVLSVTLAAQRITRFDVNNPPEGELLFERNCLCVPVMRPGVTDETMGVLVLSEKKRGEFTLLDEKLVKDFALFAAIAVNTSAELEVLRTGVDRAKLVQFPVHDLGRIRFKRGWGSVRRRLRFITSDRFKMLEARRANGEEISERSVNLEVSPSKGEEGGLPPTDEARTLAV